MAVVAAASLLTAACADEGGEVGGAEARPAGTLPTLPQPSGDRCIDVAGDLGESARAAGTLSDPPGVDLIEASADVTEAGLEVRWVANGPVNLVPDPLFAVFQGPPGRPGSFEIQAEQELGSWSVTLVVYEAAGARRSAVDAPVTVTGNEVRLTVPAAVAPPVVTHYWAWGSRVALPDGRSLIDDCDPFAAAAAGDTTTTITTPGGAGGEGGAGATEPSPLPGTGDGRPG